MTDIERLVLLAIILFQVYSERTRRLLLKYVGLHSTQNEFQTNIVYIATASEIFYGIYLKKIISMSSLNN